MCVLALKRWRRSLSAVAKIHIHTYTHTHTRSFGQNWNRVKRFFEIVCGQSNLFVAQQLDCSGNCCHSTRAFLYMFMSWLSTFLIEWTSSQLFHHLVLYEILNTHLPFVKLLKVHFYIYLDIIVDVIFCNLFFDTSDHISATGIILLTFLLTYSTFISCKYPVRLLISFWTRYYFGKQFNITPYVERFWLF